MITGMVKNGISKRIAEQIWQWVEPFARYGFNRSHAACYALIGYQTAYLRANYPVEFYTSLLNADSGDGDRAALLVSEANRIGIAILPPDVNASDSFTYTLSDPYGGTVQGTINITVAAASGAVASISLPPSGSTVNLKFSGLPFRTYEVQWSSEVSGPWTTVDSQITDEFGVILYSTNSPPDPSFWRAIRP